MTRRLRDRPTGDLLVMMIAMTICLVVLGAMSGVLLLVVFRPDETLIARIVTAIVGTVNTLIGLLAGYIAGVAGGTDLRGSRLHSVSSAEQDAS